MQAVCSPCSLQFRERKTLAGDPLVFQTSAVAGNLQTGQREVVRLRVSLKLGRLTRLREEGLSILIRLIAFSRMRKRKSQEKNAPNVFTEAAWSR